MARHPITHTIGAWASSFLLVFIDERVITSKALPLLKTAASSYTRGPAVPRCSGGALRIPHSRRCASSPGFTVARRAGQPRGGGTEARRECAECAAQPRALPAQRLGPRRALPPPSPAPATPHSGSRLAGASGAQRQHARGAWGPGAALWPLNFVKGLNTRPATSP
jgi:hypothetical protein